MLPIIGLSGHFTIKELAPRQLFKASILRQTIVIFAMEKTTFKNPGGMESQNQRISHISMALRPKNPNQASISRVLLTSSRFNDWPCYSIGDGCILCGALENGLNILNRRGCARRVHNHTYAWGHLPSTSATGSRQLLSISPMAALTAAWQAEREVRILLTNHRITNANFSCSQDKDSYKVMGGDMLAASPLDRYPRSERAFDPAGSA